MTVKLVLDVHIPILSRAKSLADTVSNMSAHSLNLLCYICCPPIQYYSAWRRLLRWHGIAVSDKSATHAGVEQIQGFYAWQWFLCHAHLCEELALWRTGLLWRNLRKFATIDSMHFRLAEIDMSVLWNETDQGVRTPEPCYMSELFSGNLRFCVNIMISLSQKVLKEVLISVSVSCHEAWYW